MTPTNEAQEPQVEAGVSASERVPAIESRFLFVDVAALRAKQLRRGALPRLPGDGSKSHRPDMPHKKERIAMEEVRDGLVPYQLPDLKHAQEEA